MVKNVQLTSDKFIISLLKEYIWFETNSWILEMTEKKIDTYALYIDELLAEAPYSAVRIKELVKEHFHKK